jgi:hypothetical protein
MIKHGIRFVVKILLDCQNHEHLHKINKNLGYFKIIIVSYPQFSDTQISHASRKCKPKGNLHINSHMEKNR